MRAALLLVVVGLTACVRSQAVVCEDDRVCPERTICDPVHHECLEPEQATVCGGLADGDVCSWTNGRGICDSGYCRPGCGDNVHGADEECDDGNFASHDGCSSACLIESVSWQQWESPWRGRLAHAAVYHSNRLLVAGGIDLSAFRGDQWERDAMGNWKPSATALPARDFTAIAYDSFRNVTVVFGGDDLTGVVGDTWEYDGSVWTKKTPASSPPARFGAAMVFDPVRRRMILFGGNTGAAVLNDVWEYNGTTWTQITTTIAPGARCYHAMVWDSDRNRAVLFGGGGPVGYNDTWEYAAGTWTQITTPTPPAPRIGHAFAYQPTRRKALLFGGATGYGEAASDTWEYDATLGWKQVSTLASPPGRYWSSLTFDPSCNCSVLIGGTTPSTLPFDDVWHFDGAWTRHMPDLDPHPRATPLTYDSAHDRVVLFGGYALDSFTKADTWLFDGTQWSRVDVASPPPGRADHATTYDSAADRVIMFGGYAAGPLDDTWQWSSLSSTWTPIVSATKPSARYFGVLAFDPELNASVLFGGADATDVLGDTWELTNGSWSRSAATGPSPSVMAALAYDPDGQRLVLLDTVARTWVYTDHAWQQLETNGTPPRRDAATMTYDPVRHRLMLYGGNSAAAVYNDLWELAGTTWTEVLLAGSRPPTRQHPGFAAHGRAPVLFGGVGTATLLGDTWLLRYSSATPDEDCTSGVDEDGDRHIDADDPDCH